MENKKKSEALRNHPRICFHPIWFANKKASSKKSTWRHMERE